MDRNGVQGVEADLLDRHSLREAVEGADTVYSMASPLPGEGDDYSANTEGMVNLLEVARESNVKTIVHLSTLDVYGFGAGRVTALSEPRPAGKYQASKLEADRTLLEFAKRGGGPRAVVVRPAKAFGPRDPLLAGPLLKMIESGRVVLPESRSMSFTHPKDIAQAMFLAATRSVPSGRVYLLKSFDSTPTGLVAGVAGLLGKTVDVSSRKLFSKGLLSAYSSDQLKAALLLEPQPTWGELGYLPRYGVQESCEEVAAWYKREPWAVDDL